MHLCDKLISKEMTLFEIAQKYPDEQTCKIIWKQYRDECGVTCRNCGGTAHYWKKRKENYQCKSCGTRTSLKSGTVMHASNLGFKEWFWTMAIMTSTKNAFSAKEVQRQLGKKRYEPVWAMMHKIRSVMGLRDDRYVLEGGVEMDEGFFTTAVYGSFELKRGRGSQKKSCVVVMAESEDVTESEQLKGKPTKRCGHFKLKMVRKMDAGTLVGTAAEHISDTAEVTTDGLPAYNYLGVVVKKHIALKVPANQADKLLPWVHTAISNAKGILRNVHRCVDEDFLGNYLNEFAFKLNRRYFECLMPRVLTAGVYRKWNYLG
jgi:hypothetical protein